MKSNLFSIFGVLFLIFTLSACMKAGQTVRWSSSQKLAKSTEPISEPGNAIWVNCQALHSDDEVIAVGGSGDRIECQIRN